MAYTCVVCGYNKLDYPQYHEGSPMFTICSCCGFESGFDDDDQDFTFDSYREKWLLSGAEWLNTKIKPQDWGIESLVSQLKRVNFDFDSNYVAITTVNGFMKIKAK